jgi:hypothetical protein
MSSLQILISLLALVTSSSLCAAPALPRTPDGQPDLQGIWTGGTLTPVERPPQHAEKTHLTPAERAEEQRQASERFWAAGHKPGDVGRDNDGFLEHLKLLPTGQTSLVVMPADGQIPLRPEALARREINLTTFDSFETMSQWDRCITREPTAMFPVAYNNAYQIVQTPNHVIIVAEMVHDARIVPLDGRPHADARVRGWAGDSRGRWEGSTLVVDTTNFNDGGWIATAMNYLKLRGVPYSKQLHMVERFTRVDRDTLHYEVTIEDPQHYTAPWKMAFPLARDDEYRMYEYACHEGNSAVEMILRGARVQEQAAQSSD